MPKKIFIATFGVLALLLAGCGQSKLSTTHSQYGANGLVAQVKGNSNDKQVSYQVDNQAVKHHKVADKTFVLSIPLKATAQKVKITSGSASKTVTVKAAKRLGSYQTIAKKYNQMMIASHLSKQDQAQAQQLQKQGAALKQQQDSIQQRVKTAKADLAKGGASAAKAAATLQAQQQAGQKLKAQAAKVQATSKSVTAAMAKAKKQVKSELLPTKTPQGLKQVLKTKDYTTRLNVQNGDLMGVAMVVPTDAFKNSSQQKKFGTAFALMANSLGANAKTVLKQFKDQTKSNRSSQTTNKTIHSKGVNFDFGLSTSDIYFFITK